MEDVKRISKLEISIEIPESWIRNAKKYGISDEATQNELFSSYLQEFILRQMYDCSSRESESNFLDWLLWGDAELNGFTIIDPDDEDGESDEDDEDGESDEDDENSFKI